MSQRLKTNEEEIPQYQSTLPTTEATTQTAPATQTLTKTTVQTPPVQTTETHAQTTTETERITYTKSDMAYFGAFMCVIGFAVGLLIFLSGYLLTPLEDKTLLARIAPQVATALFAAIGGGVALWQYTRNYYQRERELGYRQSELEKRTDEFQRKMDADALTAARKELQDQFVDIENRLASSEPMMRANAALRLAEFGTLLIPRTAKQEEADSKTPRNAENNPYFIPVASQLATALHLETNAAVRQDMVKAFASMTTWAKEEAGQELLHELIHLIADANRTAKKIFIRAWAEYNVISTGEVSESEEEIALEFVASVAPFCEEAETTKICLQSLKAEAEKKDHDGKVTIKSKYAVYQRVCQERRKRLSEVERLNEDALRLPLLETAANQLIATRDALATALVALARPNGLPEPFIKASEWRRPIPLYLYNVFLAGASLPAAQLQQICLNTAHLQGTFLYGAQLQKADMLHAWMQRVDLRSAQLQGAVLADVELQESYLQHAGLQEANLSWARMQGAEMFKTELQKAQLGEAFLEGANLTRAQLDEADLYRVKVQIEASEECEMTNFEESNWKQAINKPAELEDWFTEFTEMPEKEIINYEMWKAKAEQGN